MDDTSNSAPDVSIIDHGSLVMFALATPEARAWVDENCSIPDWAWMGLAFAVEPRMATDIALGMAAAGLEVAA